MKAIEIAGQIDDDGKLHTEVVLRQAQNKRVKVIILIPEEEEISDAAWLSSLSDNPSFDFLLSEEEDIYTLEDGQAWPDEA
ncbi:MAG: hypothetical protein GVY26_16290 [Bacteroidetes bacterium]|jgi:uncharacterized iron-regulated protein|nr:hypothetical protein [Bacteroidota bacterium]